MCGEIERYRHALSAACEVAVLIETVPALAGDAGKVAERCKRRGRELGPRGVYVLAARDGAVGAWVGEELRRQGLHEKDLAGPLVTCFRSRDYDGGAIQVVARVARFEAERRQK